MSRYCLNSELNQAAFVRPQEINAIVRMAQGTHISFSLASKTQKRGISRSMLGENVPSNALDTAEAFTAWIQSNQESKNILNLPPMLVAMHESPNTGLWNLLSSYTLNAETGPNPSRSRTNTQGIPQERDHFTQKSHQHKTKILS